MERKDYGKVFTSFAVYLFRDSVEEEIVFVKRFMLRKLANLGKFGGAHTALDNLSKGLPMHFRSSKRGQKTIKEAIKQLINDGFLLSKPSTGEPHVSINPRKIKEIKEFLEIGERSTVTPT